MKASLPNLRISPRKVRLAANLVKGKKVAVGLATLQFLPKRASAPLTKLIKSAVANSNGRADLVIKDIRVDKGLVLKRMMPRARGRAARINKRGSRVVVQL